MSSTLSGTRLRFAATQFQIISGIRRASSDCASSVTGGSGVARKGSLYILTEPRADLALGVDACQKVQQTIAREFYADPSPSTTTSLSHALARANLALLEHNRHAAPPQRALVGVSIVALHPDEAYIAQLPPSQIYLLHQGIVRPYPRPHHWPTTEPTPYLPAALGSSPADPDPDLARSPLEQGDALILCSANLASLFSEADALDHFAAADQYQIVDYLYELAAAANLGEAYAVAIVAEDAASSNKAVRPPARSSNGALPSLAPLPPTQNGPRLRLPFTLPNPNRNRQPQEEQDYQPSPITLRGNGPQVTIGDTDLPDDTVQPNQPVSPPPRNPRIDNLLALRDRLLQRNPAPSAPTDVAADDEQVTSIAPTALVNDAADLSFAPTQRIAQKDEDEEDGIHFTPPAPITRLAPQPAVAAPQPFGSHQFAEIQDEDERFVAEYLSVDDRPAATIEDEAIADKRLDLSPLTNAVRLAAAKLGRVRLPNLRRPQVAEVAVPEQERVDYAALAAERRAARPASLAPLLPDYNEYDEKYDDPLVQEQPRRLPLPTWLIVAALVVILGFLGFSIVQGMAAQKDQQLRNLLNQAGAAMSSAQNSTDKSVQRSYLADADKQLIAAAKTNPSDLDVKTARAKWQRISDDVNLVSRLPQPQILFELPVSGTTASYLSQAVVQGSDAYVLDRGMGVVYRLKVGDPQSGKAILTSGADAVKGKLLYITWRVDVLVAIDDQYNIYIYNPSKGDVAAATLGGASSFSRPLDIASYEGNLYILGAKEGQIEKYAAGQYDQPPLAWLNATASGMVGGAMKLAVDGSINVLTNNSRVLIFSGGSLQSQFDPNAGVNTVYPTANAPRGLLTSPDNQFIYIVEGNGGPPDGQGGRVLRFSKDGKLVRQFLADSSSSVLADLRSAYISPNDTTLYLVTANRLYSVPLAAAKPGGATSPTPIP